MGYGNIQKSITKAYTSINGGLYIVIIMCICECFTTQSHRLNVLVVNCYNCATHKGLQLHYLSTAQYIL